MLSPELRLVLVDGTLDAGPFLRRDLLLKPISAGDPPANTRALVLVAGDLQQVVDRARLVRWGRDHLEDAMNSGYRCIAAARSDQLHVVKQTLEAAELREIVVIEADAEAVAQHCLRLDVGPPPDQDLTIKWTKPLKPDTEMLLRRAFSGFQSIGLTELTGGRSMNDGIWRVDAQSTDSELRSPFVVKCGPRSAIDMQVRTYRDVVADRVPFRGCAPLCLDRSVGGYRKRLSVSRFVEGAKRLDAVLIDPECPGPERVIRHIFEGPLHRWRASPEKRPLQLLNQFLPSSLRKKYSKGLLTVHAKLPPGSASTPGELFNKLRSLPVQDVPVCRAHDDLNFRNVFVAEGGGEIILIDFTRAVVKPLAQDIARMDVGLAFDDELNEQQPIADEILEAYFTGDLFSISLPHNVKGKSARARLQAIEALRRQMLVEAAAQGYDPTTEYSVAIVAGLLYEAKRRTRWSARAYQCADAIVAAL